MIEPVWWAWRCAPLATYLAERGAAVWSLSWVKRPSRDQRKSVAYDPLRHFATVYLAQCERFIR